MELSGEVSLLPNSSMYGCNAQCAPQTAFLLLTVTFSGQVLALSWDAPSQTIYRDEPISQAPKQTTKFVATGTGRPTVVEYSFTSNDTAITSKSSMHRCRIHTLLKASSLVMLILKHLIS